MTTRPGSNQTEINIAFQKAIDCYKNNQFKLAEELFLSILTVEPDHIEANYSLGLLALQNSKPTDSLKFFEKALDKKPEHGIYWISYIDALDQAGLSDDALQVLNQAQQAGLAGPEVEALSLRLKIAKENQITTRDSDLADTTLSSGSPPTDEETEELISLYRNGNLPDCENFALRILKRFPGDGFFWKVLGAVLKRRGKPEAAISAMRKATSLLPHDPEILNNLGITLENAGHLIESEATLRQALTLDPVFKEAFNNLGVTLKALGKLAESEECFRHAIHLDNDYAEAYCNLGINLKDQGQLAEAVEQLQIAIRLRPLYAEAHNNLGNIQLAVGMLTEAESTLRKALKLKPDFAVAYNNLGNVLHSQGRLEESEKCYRQALKIQPDYVEAFDGLLFVSNNLPDKSSHEIYSLYQDYDKHFGILQKSQLIKTHSNFSISRRLKVGYVSPAYYNHPVMNFLLPLLEKHDKSRFEIYAYSDTLREDAVTAKYKKYVDHWVSTTGLSNQEMAVLICNDEIDILVDLAGHTGRNRLQVFARKPAPVSLHWLDFGYTTGLSSINYYLTDIHSVPIGSESLFSEQPWRLPGPALVYRPKPDMGFVNPLPAVQNGHITFGTLTRAIRINHRTIRVWSQILKHVQNSTLIINSGSFKDSEITQRLYDQFAAHGINTSRLDIGYQSPPWDLLRKIDIGLDCFPHNSGTTLFEMLFMGIPFITLADRPAVGRSGSAILEVLGHQEWIATNEQEYIEKSIHLASDLEILSSIRSRLRTEMQSSLLMNEEVFTRNIENAYSAMFKCWCDKMYSVPSESTGTSTPQKESNHKRHSEQISHYNIAIDLHLQGQLDDAKDSYIQAINIQNNFVEAYNNIGTLFQQKQKFTEAESCFLRALDFKPDYSDAHYNLGNCYKLQQKLFRAEKSYRNVIELVPNHVNAHYNLGNILQEQGRPAEAESCLRQALALKPDHINAFSTLLFALNYHPDKSSEDIFAAYQEFNTRFCIALQKEWQPHLNSTIIDRRIKIGYIAPDYSKHPARYFLEPLLAHHDKNLFETYAYVGVGKDNQSTDLFQRYVDYWQPVKDLTDQELTHKIREDAIDILVDIAGHTSGNRLGVFARKPAPISLHWLDFGYTTGLTAIDYYLTDNTVVPRGSERYFSESPYRIETPALAYRPPAETGAVSPLPALKNGYITFGTLTRAARINHRTIQVWSEILKKCKGSKLIINSGSFRETAMQESLTAQFLKHGIESTRLDIGCSSPPWDVLRTIDIGLDCFPHNSGTTLVESLYMGVPCVSLAERPSMGTLGSSILKGVGHSELIAQTENEYISIAVTLTTDIDSLSRLRSGLREEMEASPLMDESGFTRKVETAYRDMFKKWCEAGNVNAPAHNHKSQIVMKNRKKNRKQGKADAPDPTSVSKQPLASDIRKLLTLFQQGDQTKAIPLARSLISKFPDHGLSWKLLGPLLYQQGEFDEAIAAMKQAVVCLPNDPEAHLNLGIALQQQGLAEDAKNSYHKCLEIKGDNIQALYNLGNIYAECGQLSQAVDCYEQALILNPDHFEIHCNLGNILKKLGKFNASAKSYRNALKIRPDSADILSNLSLTLKEQELFDDAESACRKALQLRPDFAEAHNNLGLILQKQDRNEEAEESYTKAIEHNSAYAIAHNNLGQLLLQSARLDAAQSRLQRAIDINPDFAEAHINLGNVYLKQGKYTEAATTLKHALATQPDNLQALNNLSVTFIKLGKNTDAEKTCRKIIQLCPDYSQAYHNLSDILCRQDQFAEAEHILRQALTLNPESISTYNNLLFLLNYSPDKTQSEIFAEYIEFNKRFAIQFQHEWKPHSNEPQIDRRLKVGYVGSQFRRHSARHFLEPLLEHHNKNRIEVYAYAELFHEDEQTDRYRALVDHWISTTGMSDNDVAERIRNDRIDVLIDLAGHTEGNRLMVFARKPAPVSLHWLDFGYTTGLSAIDYYLTDNETVPPGSEEHFSESPWRIETPCLAYRPADNMGEVSPLPCGKNGHVTFGTLTRGVRINHRTIRIWSKILTQVENAHLVIDSGDFIDPNIQNALVEKFVAYGIDRARLKIGFHSPPWDILRSLDIGLDCFPHNSGTTLFETLYMGVPFITLADRPSVGRLGSSILTGIGHQELIAYTEEEYVQLAVSLAHDIPRLKCFRNNLRDSMQQSPLMNEAAFALKMENAYREMFKIWVKQQYAQHSSSDQNEKSVLINQAFQHALACIQSGRIQEAEDLFHSIVTIEPKHPEANFNLGLLAFEFHNPEDSLPYFEVAVEVRPHHSPYWLAYIEAIDKTGKHEEALQLIEMAMQAGLHINDFSELKNRLSGKNIDIDTEPLPEQLEKILLTVQQQQYEEAEIMTRTLLRKFPNNGFLWKALGFILKMQSRIDDATDALQQALRLSSEDIEVYQNLGECFLAQQAYDKAEDIYRKSIHIFPDVAELHYSLANALAELGKHLESEKYYHKALSINPNFAEAYFNLANLLRKQNRLYESQSLYEKAISEKNHYTKAYCNLGIALQLQGKLKEAEEKYKKALEIEPLFIEAHINLGACMKESGRYQEAELQYNNALSIQPEHALCFSNLGSVLKEQGRLAEAESALRRALELNPGYIEAHSNLLFLLNYNPDKSGEEIFLDYKQFEINFGTPGQVVHPVYTNDLQTDRPLKVGYVSPQFRLHSVRHFLEPLLANHNKQNVEIYAYAENTTEDHITEKYKSYVDHWRITSGISDSDLAALIKSDGIDILVDLAGHTAHNRLRVFTFKPAPVSLHWLDFGYTTGLTSIDYYLTDIDTVPTGSEGLFAEVPWRITTPALVYRPAEGMGETNSLPARDNGYVTFGTLTRAVRINQRTVRVWSEIMKQVEDSHLIIDSSNFQDIAMQEQMAEMFVAHGISRDRLEIGFHTPPWDVIRSLDICFDCFPHNSGTTLFETLYLGVPFITLADRPSVGRLGSSILTGLGHPEWIATTEEEYINLAIRMAGDLNTLENIRTNLQQKMKSSPLMDEVQFTHKMESAYREMFTTWSKKQQSTHSSGAEPESGLFPLDESRSLSSGDPAPPSVSPTISQHSHSLRNKKSKRPQKERSRSSQPTEPHANTTQKLVNLYEQKRWVEAEAYGRSLIENYPNSNVLWKILGAVYRQQGAADNALTAMKRALECMPDDHICMRNIAVILCELDKYIEAEAYCRNALKRNQNYADCYTTLSIALRGQNKLDDAEKSCRIALNLKPESAETYVNLGLILNEDKRFAEAETCYRKAITLNPSLIEAYCGLSVSLQSLKKMTEAEGVCRQAIALNPLFATSYNCLGGIFFDTGRFEEAQSAYQQAVSLKPQYSEALHNLGRTHHKLENYTQAEECYSKLLKITPRNAQAHYSLGITLSELGKRNEAEQSYLQAIKFRPDYPEAYINLGNTYRMQGWIYKAETQYRNALSFRPGYLEAQNNLGSILQEQGRLSESEDVFREILGSNPNFPDAFGNLLFLMNYHPDKNSAEIYHEYIEFEKQYGTPLKIEWQPHTNSQSTDRRLKIGYVSPQFCQHPVCNFLEPLLANHDKALFELYGYAEQYKIDDTTERYASYMDHWIPTQNMTDAEFTERVRADGIDLLVDLAGHTGHNRLLVFARKPAPVSLHWLDFGYTTGLKAIDYYLTDKITVPNGSENLFSETPWKMNRPALVYRPTPGMGEVNNLPALEKGYITFGSLSRAVRLNYRLIRVWAEILKNTPGSRLIINSGSFKDPLMQQTMTQKFATHGIDPERLEIGCNSPPWDILRSIDIGFDCFPHNSGTTLFETLYMGIPFVTLASRPSVGCLGHSVLHGIGHEELVAGSEEEYIEIASTLAANLPKLTQLRTNLRKEMEESPLMDEPGFTRNVEDAYKQMFAKWCKEQK